MTQTRTLRGGSRSARPGAQSSGDSGSLWADGVDNGVARPVLDADVDVDVAIVGGGYTGLWTAYSLLRADPTMRVLVVERETVGFGASGRNGGWCVGELAGGLEGWVRSVGRDAGIRQTHAIIESVDEIGRVIAGESIDCGFVKSGVIRLARNGAQRQRQVTEVAVLREHGFGSAVAELLDAGQTTARLAATNVVGSMTYEPCARIHPLRLATGLAAAVERIGGRIIEGTAVLSITPGRPVTVATTHGTVRAEVVVRATEAYTRDLPGARRDLIPLYSLMIATEPLPPDVWEAIGLRRCETFSDDRHMVIYGQRTMDDRIAFGGRGAPYMWGSGIDASRETDRSTHDRLVQTLVEMFPTLRGASITHRWGGVLGVPRDWRPSVGLDRSTGSAWAGGYVGEGVAASNLAGRTLADLIVGNRSDLVTLPWVGHRSRRWEPEPLRWLGVTALRRAVELADRAESRSGRPSKVASVINRFVR